MTDEELTQAAVELAATCENLDVASELDVGVVDEYLAARFRGSPRQGDLAGGGAAGTFLRGVLRGVGAASRRIRGRGRPRGVRGCEALHREDVGAVARSPRVLRRVLAQLREPRRRRGTGQVPEEGGARKFAKELHDRAEAYRPEAKDETRALELKREYRRELAQLPARPPRGLSRRPCQGAALGGRGRPCAGGRRGRDGGGGEEVP